MKKLLESDPGNARLHDAAAAIFLSLHRYDRARAHLDAALRIDPRLVSAQYNIATALLALNEPDAAIEHLRRAVSFVPIRGSARQSWNRAEADKAL